MKRTLSFADGCQCGDGTVYRASNFVPTGIKKSKTIRIDADGNIFSDLTCNARKPNQKQHLEDSIPLDGYQLRCIYSIDKSHRKRLTVPEAPFSKIDEIGAGMYKGQKATLAERHVGK